MENKEIEQYVKANNFITIDGNNLEFNAIVEVPIDLGKSMGTRGIVKHSNTMPFTDSTTAEEAREFYRKCSTEVWERVISYKPSYVVV